MSARSFVSVAGGQRCPRLRVRRRAGQRCEEFADIARAGVRGIAVSFVNHLNDVPYFCGEALPRLARMGSNRRWTAEA
jgi:hypothetical protein